MIFHDPAGRGAPPDGCAAAAPSFLVEFVGGKPEAVAELSGLEIVDDPDVLMRSGVPVDQRLDDKVPRVDAPAGPNLPEAGGGHVLEHLTACTQLLMVENRLKCQELLSDLMVAAHTPDVPMTGTAGAMRALPMPRFALPSRNRTLPFSTVPETACPPINGSPGKSVKVHFSL